VCINRLRVIEGSIKLPGRVCERKPLGLCCGEIGSQKGLGVVARYEEFEGKARLSRKGKEEEGGGGQTYLESVTEIFPKATGGVSRI